MAPHGSGGSIDDTGMKWKLGYVDVPYSQMSLTLVEGTPNLLGSLGAGLPNIIEAGVAAAEQAGIKMDTGDEAYGRLWFPWWMNKAHDVKCQVFALVEEASKANIDWKAWIKGIAAGQVESDAKVSADGNLTFPAMSNTSAGEVVKSPIMGFGLGDTFEDDDYAMFAVELDDKGTATADKVFLLNVRFFMTIAATSDEGIRRTT